MQKVLVIGMIVIPLVMFLALFGNRITTNTQTNAESAKTKTDSLATAAARQWSF
ncbi:hypothetical protein GCM10007939_04710 [Amylibacter marinus]|uniref:Uncharacterized protein n=1 Tax=Amylibacter marinus TaxID=1475483 RepID=A0ABQ5VSI7_9RHOB|nr:hypothetical protein [Amylibacter marinus]GLQ34188.1 hypothetical protein GCM10007939_04710 [Amylibacter marinus]